MMPEWKEWSIDHSVFSVKYFDVEIQVVSDRAIDVN